ncbi:MAG: amino acid synthesis family protein [Modestobacter sp.]|nr:amino acid synthesis family protein [Modestobacter sp.]
MTDATGIRKRVTVVEVLDEEGGRPVTPPLRMAIAAVVMANPWAGRGFVEDLTPEILAIAPGLGKLLTDDLVSALGGPDAIEAYGKAAVVGLNGELEHASALIHTLRFGNLFRERVGGSSYLPFTNRRAGAGTTLSIPLVDKNDSGRRSHYLTTDLMIADAPGPDELVVAIAGATGGRPFARIGDRYQDEREMDTTGR